MSKQLYPVMQLNGTVRTAYMDAIKEEMDEGKVRRAKGSLEYYEEIPQRNRRSSTANQEPPPSPDEQVYMTRDQVAEPNRRRKRPRGRSTVSADGK